MGRFCLESWLCSADLTAPSVIKAHVGSERGERCRHGNSIDRSSDAVHTKYRSQHLAGGLSRVVEGCGDWGARFWLIGAGSSAPMLHDVAGKELPGMTFRS
jgi:hypothetical protein